jgi:hypothetical protein
MAAPSLRRFLTHIPRLGCSATSGRLTRQVPSRLAVESLEDRCLLSTLQAISLPPANQPPSDTAAGASSLPSVSDDGRYVAFQSAAPNLMSGETGGANKTNVFLLDRSMGTMTLVSHIAGSATAASDSASATDPIISANGRFVVYNTTDAGQDLLVIFDTTTGQNTPVTPPPGLSNAQDEAISTDGHYVLYSVSHVDQFGDQTDQLLLLDQVTHTTYLVTHPFGQNNVPDTSSLIGTASVADDGSVVYLSYATDLVSSATTIGHVNVYLYRPATQSSQLVSTVSSSATVDAGGCQDAVLSRDGSTVVFASTAPDVVPNQSGAARNVFRYSVSQGTTTLASGAGGSPTASGDGDSGGSSEMAVSANGQFVAFASLASDLVSGQSGATSNVFLYNAQLTTLTLLSGVNGSATVGAGGITAKSALSISADGSLVAYVSQAGNIIPGQTGPADIDNVFLYNGALGQSSLVSGANASITVTANAPSDVALVSGAGNLLVVQSLATNLNSSLFDGNAAADVFTYTPGGSGAALVSRAAFAQALSGPSFATSVSADGRFTVFTSTADLVANEVAVNPNQNIFLYDKQTASITLVNHVPGLPATTGNGGIGPTGARLPRVLEPVISADGSFIAFTSTDTNLVVPNINPRFTYPNYLYLYSVQTGVITFLASQASSPAISADGAFIAYEAIRPFGTAQSMTVLYDRVANTPTLINSSLLGASDLTISDDGRYVAYVSSGVYVFDRNSGMSNLVSHTFASLTTPSSGNASAAILSHDGSSIDFVSDGTDLVSGQTPSGTGGLTNVFLYKNDGSGAVSLVSGVNGSATLTGNGNSDSPAIDGDGSYVAYRSDAANLVGTQTGSNIYEFNTTAHTQALVSHQAGSLTAAAGGCSNPVIDEDGHLVAYVSTAGDLIPNQSGTAGIKNVFLWLRQTGANILASGQNGSPILTGDADSDVPLLTRYNFLGFSSIATNLAHVEHNLSAAYINTLVQLALSAHTVADGSPTGTVVGTLIVTSLLAGQYLLPTYSLPATEADNASFSLGANGGETLATNFQANYAARQSFQVSVHVNVGFGDQQDVLNVAVATLPALNKAFVSQVYLDLLKRPVDDAGLAFWSGQLDNGGQRSLVSQALTHSDEYFATIIKPAYVKFLGRAADAGGIAYWTSLMHAGLTDEQLEANFIASPEYYAHNGGTDKGWIDGTYVDLLGRQPDASGENFWIMQAGVIGRGGVALGFAKSAESEMRHVEADYMTYLLRSSDPAGLAFWTNQFILGGQTNEDMITGFLASDEYFKRSTT